MQEVSHAHVRCYCARVIWTALCTFMCVRACACDDNRKKNAEAN